MCLERALAERDKARCEIKRVAKIMSQEHEEELEELRQREIERLEEFKESTQIQQVQREESQIISVQRLETQCREIEFVALQETSSLRDEISELRYRNEALTSISSSNEQNAARPIESKMLRKDSQDKSTTCMEESFLLETQCHHRKEQEANERVVTILREEIHNARSEVSCLKEDVTNALSRLRRADSRRNALMDEVSELKDRTEIDTAKLRLEYDSAIEDLKTSQTECQDLRTNLQDSTRSESDVKILLEQDARRRVSGVTSCMMDRVQRFESDSTRLREENDTLKKRNAELEAEALHFRTVSRHLEQQQNTDQKKLKNHVDRHSRRNHADEIDDDELVLLSRECIREQKVHLLDRIKLLESERTRVKQILQDMLQVRSFVLVDLVRVLDDQHDRLRKAYHAVCDAEIHNDDFVREISETRSGLKRTRKDFQRFMGGHVRSLMNDVPHIKEHNTKVSGTTTTTMTLEGDEDEEKYVHNKRTISANRTGRHKRASSRHHIPKEEGQEEVESKFKPYTSTEQYINRSIENWARDRRDAQRMVRRHITWLRTQIGVLGEFSAVASLSTK